jgi:hypothetical protein
MRHDVSLNYVSWPPGQTDKGAIKAKRAIGWDIGKLIKGSKALQQPSTSPIKEQIAPARKSSIREAASHGTRFGGTKPLVDAEFLELMFTGLDASGEKARNELVGED